MGYAPWVPVASWEIPEPLKRNIFDINGGFFQHAMFDYQGLIRLPRGDFGVFTSYTTRHDGRVLEVLE